MGLAEDFKKFTDSLNTNWFTSLNTFLNNINYTSTLLGNTVSSFTTLNDKIGWWAGSLAGMVMRPFESIGYSTNAILGAWTQTAWTFGGTLDAVSTWFEVAPIPVFLGLGLAIILALILPDPKLKIVGLIAGLIGGYLIGKFAGL